MQFDKKTISKMFQKNFIMSCDYSEMNWVELNLSWRKIKT